MFDRYIEDSLQAQTRSKRTGNLPVHYRVLEETQIGHLDTKQFLSSIKTKNELTVYLGQKLASVMTSKPVDYVAVYKQTCLTNLQDLNLLLMNHNQEEADTSIVLYAIDVTQRNPSTDVVISCSDTDVLLILLNYFDSICLSTTFRTSSHDMPLRFAYENLEEIKCKALLGFHALTGCGQTGKFYGFSKLSC